MLASSAATGAEVLDDPMRPARLAPGVVLPPSPRAPVWLLESTRVGEIDRVAVINGDVAQVGDVVNGATLLAIEPGRVWLRQGERRFELKLLPDDVKQLREND